MSKQLLKKIYHPSLKIPETII